MQQKLLEQFNQEQQGRGQAPAEAVQEKWRRWGRCRFPLAIRTYCFLGMKLNLFLPLRCADGRQNPSP